MKSMYTQYFDHHNNYVTKYGIKTIVLMQVGSFYEAYAAEKLGCDIVAISSLLNVNYTKTDKNKAIVNERNPHMLGFPCPVLHKFLRVLINDGYTVIKIDQITENNSINRKVTQIYSPGTYIDEASPESNNIISIFIEDILQQNLEIQYCIGISIIDLTTGECYLYETYSKDNDEKLPLDEIVRVINSYKPKEVIINRLNDTKNKSVKTLTKEDLLLYLEITGVNHASHYSDNASKKYFSKAFIQDFLHKIYKVPNVLEYLDIELMSYATVSFIFGLEFAHQHNETLIESMNKPVILRNEEFLVLGNNALSQLNVIGGTEGSLYDIINNLTTAIGKRFLKKELINPIVNKKDLEKRYNYIETMLKNDFYIEIEKVLKDISDIERLNRKLALKTLHPYEFTTLLQSYISINNIITLISKNKSLASIIPNKKVTTSLKELIKESETMFNIEESKKYNINDIKTNIFNPGVFIEIDKFQTTIAGNITIITKISDHLSSLLPQKTGIKIMNNEKEGYYFQVSKNKFKILEKLLETDITIGNIKINKDTFTYKILGSAVKIYFKKIESFSNNDVSNVQEEMEILIKKKYIETCGALYTKYRIVLVELVKFIALVDFYKSGAKTARLYNYCKPVIKDNSNGYISCEQLRHPIIERIKTDTEYIPHDIKLGKSESNSIEGLLIYGLNSSGKSSLMKAIGLSIIMAQIGYYVPATSYTFSPYTSCFARITGNDNIFKGLSSFSLEMTELKAILNRTGPRTLVIGDEVCRGTEHISGNAIVASTILKLASTSSSFIFATHLHEIAKMDRIKKLTNVKAYHLTVEYDEVKDTLIYDRLLKEGPGEPIYGYIVAKYIIQDLEFMKNVQEIKNELTNEPNTLVHDKKSKYNSKIYMTSCQVCNKSYNSTGKNVGHLDTHHINFQSKCKNGFATQKPHVAMNSKANLVILCKECHYNVHHDKLIINGYKETTTGVVLDFIKKLN